ncbi:MAG: bacillithiol biosynthesis deacetylase BshB1 [Candidatus Heimdallarchaeota archaeon]
MLDVLVFAPHPDDAELGAGGAIVKAVKKGLKVGIIDLTAGEKSTHGNVELRKQEAQKAKEVLGVTFRDNLEFPDGYLPFIDTEKPVFTLAKKIREHQPEIVLVPYWEDRHPDHVAASSMITKAIHYSKLAKIELDYPKYKVEKVLYYELNGNFTPTLIMDISEEFVIKEKAIMSFKSQFKKFTKEYLPFPVIERCKHYGSLIKREYGEAYLMKDPLMINDWEMLL